MKTISLKKVSAVAVASLGFGLLSVVPANAALATTVAKVGPGAAGDAAPGTSQNLYTSAGTEVTSDIRILTTTAETNAGSITITPTVACAGTVATVCTGGLTVGTPGTGKVGMTLTGPTLGATIATTATATKWTASVADGVESLTWSSGTIPAIATTALEVVGRLSMTPTIPGIYTVTLTPAGAVTTNTATVYTLYVSGAAGTVGTAGVGTTSVSASTGGNAVVEYFTANGTTVGSVYNITSTGVGSIVGAQGYTTAHGTASLTTPYNGTTGDYSAGAKFTTATATTPSSATVTLASSVAGTQTITVTAIDATTGNPTTAAIVTVIWGSSPAVSATYSTAYIGSGTAFPTANWDPAVAISKTAGVNAAQATIGVTLKDQNQASISGVALTATITGAGLISCSAGTGTGAVGTVRACSLTAATMTTNVARFGVTADGSSGTGTITITSGTTTIATKTVVFYGSVATLTATQNLSIARAACSTSCVLGSSSAAPAGTSVATTPAVTIVAKDSSGNVVPGLTLSAVSSDANVLAGATILESNGLGLGDGYAGLGYYNASISAAPAGVSGKSATITFRIINPADGVSYINTAALKFTLGGSVATGTVTAAFNKSSYAPGEAAVFTVTAKDSSGNPVYDQDVNLWGGTGTAPVFSKSVNGSTPSDAATAMFIGGKKEYKMYAPSLGGAFSAAGTLDSLTVLSGAAVSASSSVTDANAGLMTQIDALNAKIVALNALIAKIMKKLGVK